MPAHRDHLPVSLKVPGEHLRALGAAGGSFKNLECYCSVWGPGVYLSLLLKWPGGFGGRRLFLIPLSGSSSLDSVHEALRLLELVPRSAQNRDRLLDDRAQALLWLYICTLESKLEKVWGGRYGGGGCGVPKQVPIWKHGAPRTCVVPSALPSTLSAAPQPPKATRTPLATPWCPLTCVVKALTAFSPLLQSIERDQRAKAQGVKNLDDFEPNDLNYEGRLLEDRFLYDGIAFNLATETGEHRGRFRLFEEALQELWVLCWGVSDPGCPFSSLQKPG